MEKSTGTRALGVPLLALSFDVMLIVLFIDVVLVDEKLVRADTGGERCSSVDFTAALGEPLKAPARAALALLPRGAMLGDCKLASLTPLLARLWPGVLLKSTAFRSLGKSLGGVLAAD